ncbi:hypothetical protein BASA81_003397 [Batrachochytrium salamandrivorans]|nr:hypothetical protein BASA81_003397 [Batrachochytrium salamandrivorans]
MVFFACCVGGEEGTCYGERKERAKRRQQADEPLLNQRLTAQQHLAVPEQRRVAQPRITICELPIEEEEEDHVEADDNNVEVGEEVEINQEANLKSILRKDVQIDSTSSRQVHVLQTIYEPVEEEKEEEEEYRPTISSGIARSLARVGFAPQPEVVITAPAPIRKVPAFDSGLNHQASFPFPAVSSVVAGSWNSLLSFGSSYDSDSSTAWQVGSVGP